MERNKEVKRGSMSTRRRHRITSVPDSLDGDREVLNENKRIKVERLAVKKRFNREEEDEGADVDSSDEENNRRISPANSSISSHSIRRPVRGSGRSPSALRIIDETIIGAPVPRKARSASSKRIHENWSLGEEQSHLKFSPSLDVASSSSQSGSLRNKKKKSTVKTRFRLSSTSTKSFSSVQDDIEIEVAEALFDLMNQERSRGVDKVADDKSICSPDAVNGKEAISIQSDLIEIKANNEKAPKMEIERCLIKLDETIMAERIELRKEESVGKANDSNEGPAHGDIFEESGKSTKLSVDNPVYSASSKAKANWSAKMTETKQEAKFKIGMKKQDPSPPMPLSPKREGLFDYPQIVMQDVQMKGEKGVLNEETVVGKEQEEKKMESCYIKQGSVKLDSEMAYQDNVGISCVNKPQQEGEKESNRWQAPIVGGEKFDQTHQPPPFSLSKPRKKCVTHQDIARNIQFHQHLTKNSSPAGVGAGAGAATLIGAKLHHLNHMPSAQDMITGYTSQGGIPGRQSLSMVSGHGGKDKASGAAENVDAANVKQLMLQQGLQQVPTANMMHRQATLFQLGQHQASMAAPINQPGSLKSAPAVGNSSGGAPVSSSASLAGTAVLNFSHANMPSNAASPYMTIFQNNGYPMSFSATAGGPPPIKGGAHPQAVMMPFYNGSYYSSPMFHMSQSSQSQQSHSQPQVHTSSSMQPHGQPQTGAQISHNTYFPQTPMLLHQSEKQQAGKAAAETSQKNKALIAESPASQKSNNNKQFMVAQTSSNQSEQQGSKGGYQLMPPQAFGLSFSSASSTTPTGFQILPDMGRQAYQFAPGTQLTQHKNFQMAEGKIVVGSISNTEEKKGISKNSHSHVSAAAQSRNGSKSNSTQPSTSTLMGTAVIDSSGRTVSFVQLPNSNALPCSFITTNLPNNNPIFSQALHQTSSSSPSSHRKYLPSYQVSSPFNAASLKEITQQQLIHSQGQTHIAFGSASTFQGQQFGINPTSKGTSGSSNIVSTSSKSVPTSEALPSQKSDTSRSTPPNQKSSPVCG